MLARKQTSLKHMLQQIETLCTQHFTQNEDFLDSDEIIYQTIDKIAKKEKDLSITPAHHAICTALQLALHQPSPQQASILNHLINSDLFIKVNYTQHPQQAFELLQIMAKHENTQAELLQEMILLLEQTR